MVCLQARSAVVITTVNVYVCIEWTPHMSSLPSSDKFGPTPNSPIRAQTLDSCVGPLLLPLSPQPRPVGRPDGQPVVSSPACTVCASLTASAAVGTVWKEGTVKLSPHESSSSSSSSSHPTQPRTYCSALSLSPGDRRRLGHRRRALRCSSHRSSPVTSAHRSDRP
ncbi:hypothetical protein U9M48_006056 [Paspalum notatum var. saurae]|uniref:Uncharacterized protein n=1 Tax=Paspalum notatum var. saurae TaxID=547442 RepID=A0AAQ3PRG2_PASNO